MQPFVVSLSGGSRANPFWFDIANRELYSIRASACVSKFVANYGVIQTSALTYCVRALTYCVRALTYCVRALTYCVEVLRTSALGRKRLGLVRPVVCITP